MHLAKKLRPLAAPLAHPAEHRVAGVLVPDVPNELGDDECLPHAGAAEDRCLAAFLEWADQVNDLDAGLENLRGGRLIDEGRRSAVDRIATHSLHRALAIDRIPDDVEEASERVGTNRHRDGSVGVEHLHATTQAVGRVHRHRAHPVVAEVLLYLGDDLAAVRAFALHLERVVDFRKLALFERDVEDRADDLDDPPVVRRGRARIVPSLLFRVYDHRYHPLLMASAPEAISSISFVMRPCLALFAASVRSSRSSDALSVAFRIETIRADCSEAALSSAAW